MSRSVGDLETRRADAAARKSIHRRRRRISPATVLLPLAVLASLAFVGWATVSHDAPVPMLIGGTIAVGLVFAVVTAVTAVSTYRAGAAGRAGRALLLALIGGSSAIAAGLAFASAYILLSVRG